MKVLSIIGIIISLLLALYGMLIPTVNDNYEIRMVCIFFIAIPNLFFLVFSIVSVVATYKKKKY